MVYWQVESAGSAQDIRGYSAAARALGHELLFFAQQDTWVRQRYEFDLDRVDALIFVCEWNIYWRSAGDLELVRLLAKVPRRRRVVLDCDGMYADALNIDGDFNHPDAAASAKRVGIFDGLADKIYQPALKPERPNVGAFLFHGYDPAWEQPLTSTEYRVPSTEYRGGKPYGMVYVGNNWFRWQALRRVLSAMEPIRDRVGRSALVGRWWDDRGEQVDPALRRVACQTDPAYLARLGVELLPPVPVEQVIATMGEGVFNPVLIRPLFEHLGLVTCRTFETPAANTIPLFAQRPEYVRAIYGDAALPLVLAEGAAATEQIADVLANPGRYAALVRATRAHLARHHSYTARLKELLEIVAA